MDNEEKQDIAPLTFNLGSETYQLPFGPSQLYTAQKAIELINEWFNSYKKRTMNKRTDCWVMGLVALQIASKYIEEKTSNNMSNIESQDLERLIEKIEDKLRVLKEEAE